MKVFARAISLLALLLISAQVSAFTFSEQTICGQTPPAGWVVVDMTYNYIQCGTTAPPSINSVHLYRYDNVPIGTQFRICNVIAPIPPGYTMVETHNDYTLCGSSLGNNTNPNVMTVRHDTCMNGQTDCYSPGVYASPAQVTAPYGQMYGTVNASWNSPDNRPACVWVKSTYGSTVQTAFWRCGVTGTNIPWSWVRVGGTTQFLLSMSSTSSTPTIATTGNITAVQGAQPTLTATPSHVIVPVGQTNGSYTLAWNSPGYPAVDLWGRINNTGAWNGPVGVVPSSSATQTFAVGTTHTWRSYAPGSPGPNSAQPTTGLLKEATTYASH